MLAQAHNNRSNVLVSMLPDPHTFFLMLNVKQVRQGQGSLKFDHKERKSLPLETF